MPSRPAKRWTSTHDVAASRAAHPTSADDPSAGLGTPLGSTTAHPPAGASGSQSVVVPAQGSDRVRPPSPQRRLHQTPPRSARSTLHPLAAAAPPPRLFSSESFRRRATGISDNTATPHGADRSRAGQAPDHP